MPVCEWYGSRHPRSERWLGGQVVRRRSRKPKIRGSIPRRAWFCTVIDRQLQTTIEFDPNAICHLPYLLRTPVRQINPHGGFVLCANVCAMRQERNRPNFFLGRLLKLNCLFLLWVIWETFQQSYCQGNVTRHTFLLIYVHVVFTLFLTNSLPRWGS